MYKNILLAVDGSEHSLRATREAIKIATLSTIVRLKLFM